MKSGRSLVRRTTWQIFRWPLAMAILSLIGLVSALIGDGWYDTISWIALGASLALIAAAWRGLVRRFT